MSVQRQRSSDPLRAMHERAGAAGAECLATEWLGSNHRYRFRCPLGHEWSRTSRAQNKNPRCLHCSRAEASLAQRAPDIFGRIVQAAKDRGGACKSGSYQGSYARYSFVCAEGHSWAAPGYRILSGTWCRTCSYTSRRGIPKSAEEREKVSNSKRMANGLERLQAIASSRGGICLSDGYRGCRAKYRFRCANGHEFEAAGNNVTTHGSWCRQCAVDARRLSLDDAHSEAKARGGLCLSEQYVNVNSALVWSCDRGHVWKAPLSDIRTKGHWCKLCADMAKITNRHSKARAKYRDAGRKLMTSM